MHDLYAQTLGQIVVQHGRSVCEEPRRLKALLADYLGQHAGDHEPAINVLILALENRVVQDLLISDALPSDMVQRRIADRLRSNLALTEQSANWAVATWSAALLPQPTAVPATVGHASIMTGVSPKPQTQPVVGMAVETEGPQAGSRFDSLTQGLPATPAPPASRMMAYLLSGCLGGAVFAGLLLWLFVGPRRSDPPPTTAQPDPVAESQGKPDKLISDLQLRLDQLTKAGKLDEALVVRDQLRQLTGEIPILVNGSFEEGPPADFFGYTTLRSGSTAIKGWTVTVGEVDHKTDFWQHAQGRCSIDLNGFMAGGLKQSFSTIKGLKYRVSFAFAGNPDGPAVTRMRIQAAGQSAEFTFDTTGRDTRNMGWQAKTWDFTANADQATLEFASLVDGWCGPAIDKVAVTIVRP